MPYSHHSHSGQFCGHAKNTLGEVMEQAQKRRFRVFCCTEHIPRSKNSFYPTETISETEASLRTKFEDFVKEAHRIRPMIEAEEMVLHGSEGMRMLVGFESEWIRPDEDYEKNLMEELLGRIGKDLDFCVGSVHHVHGSPIDFDKHTYQTAVEATSKKSEEGLFEDYFDAQHEMLKKLKPAVVGHFDVIRLKSSEPDGGLKRWPGVWERVIRNLELVKEQEGVLELNSAALRKGLKEPYPCHEVCEAFIEMGGKGFVMSDDSHGAAEVAACYREALEFLKSLGVKEIFYLRRKTIWGDGVVPVGVSIEDVEKEEFWQTVADVTPKQNKGADLAAARQMF